MPYRYTRMFLQTDDSIARREKCRAQWLVFARQGELQPVGSIRWVAGSLWDDAYRLFEAVRHDGRKRQTTLFIDALKFLS